MLCSTFLCFEYNHVRRIYYDLNYCCYCINRLVGIVCDVKLQMFVSLSNRVDEGFSTMDVYLKKRFDLIPNLVETVKGYAKHEADTLSSVIAQRNMAKTSKDVMDSENKITNAIQGIFAVAEQYPDLKANTNFMDLQNQLKKVEEDIANSRKYYNALVREYNDVIMSVPTNIVASLVHFEKKTMFEVANTSERENVQVKF